MGRGRRRRGLSRRQRRDVLNGGQIGGFTETGGKLVISFASSGVSASVVDAVLQGLGYSYGGAPNPAISGVVIGVRIDDANNDPIGLNGFVPDASGPHDRGLGVICRATC